MCTDRRSVHIVCFALFVASVCHRSEISRGDVVRTVDVGSQSLVLHATSVAELVRAAGLFIAVTPNMSARDHELNLERMFLEHDLRVFESYREPEAENPWSFVVSNPRDIEEALSTLGCVLALHIMRLDVDGTTYLAFGCVWHYISCVWVWMALHIMWLDVFGITYHVFFITYHVFARVRRQVFF